MFANGITFVPVIIEDRISILEVYDMHELEAIPEMHHLASPFDGREKAHVSPISRCSQHSGIR
ncbi:hypothetical protein FRB91_008945 [Serendipita sp. 411]|nr:hypothetical protein FRC18_011914 [Serendipita sp. 400]KAG8824071.1 hypothetical protein FRC19_002612 [Serendipita sp. 401]KAG8850562.1 hypothetical protein FRB91_008945 [Serendipita sp. 411]KAG9055585.1 hypothetical protein FS842_001778 [Serendipita sp. 407]